MRLALLVFAVAFVFAAEAFFYRPPEVMKHQMLHAVARQSAWAIQAEGELEGGWLHLDLVHRGNGAELVRIAYPPLKLINNQWIELHNSPSPRFARLDSESERAGEAGQPSLNLFILTKRLTSLKDLWRRVERFEFTLNVPPHLSGTGVIWLDARTHLPRRAIMNASGVSAPEAVRLSFAYRDPTGGVLLSARPLAEVIAQLGEFSAARNGQPKPLVPLSSGSLDTAAFLQDFDHDGLTDALEIFYGTDPVNPDTDSDTHLDGAEVEQGYNPAGAGRLNGQ